jgi:hypothetical protein
MSLCTGAATCSIAKKEALAERVHTHMLEGVRGELKVEKEGVSSTGDWPTVNAGVGAINTEGCRFAAALDATSMPKMKLHRHSSRGRVIAPLYTLIIMVNS